MRFVVRHMVLLSLLFYLLSGFGSAFGAFWCLSGNDACAPGQPCALRCLPHSGGAASLTSADHLLDEGPCGPFSAIELWVPAPKTRVRPLRSSSVQSIMPPPVRLASAVLDPDLSLLSSGQAASGPLLAQRYLRSVVMLN